MEKKNVKLPEGWQFETFEVLPGLFLSKRLVEPYDFASLGVDAIVARVQGLNRSGIVVARSLMFLGYSAAEAIDLVRRRRGLDEGFGALGNERFVEWLLLEEAGMEGGQPRKPVGRAE